LVDDLLFELLALLFREIIEVLRWRLEIASSAESTIA
jgi:hypothetical protein